MKMFFEHYPVTLSIGKDTLVEARVPRQFQESFRIIPHCRIQKLKHKLSLQRGLYLKLGLSNC